MDIKKNTLYQLLNLGFAGVSMLFFTIVIARILGTKAFGLYSYVFTYAGVFGIFYDFGLDVTLTKKVAVDKGETNIIGQLLFLKSITCGFTFLFYFLLGYLILRISLSLLILAGLGVLAASFISFGCAYFRGIERLDYEALFGILQKFIFIPLAILTAIKLEVEGIFASLTSTNLLILMMIYVFLRKREVNINIKPYNFSETFDIFRKEALPLFFIALFTFLYFRIDMLMLKWFKGEAVVGIYAASYRLMEGFTLFPSALMAALFPRLAYYASVDKNNFITYFLKGLILLSALGALLLLLSLFFGKEFILLLYGSAYKASCPLFLWLMVALFLIYPNFILTQSIIALNQQRVYALTSFIAFIANIALNLLLIPKYSATGAAISTIFTELILGVSLAIVLFTTLRQFRKVNP